MSIFKKLLDAVANAAYAVFGPYHSGGVVFDYGTNAASLPKGEEIIPVVLKSAAEVLAERGFEKLVDKRGRVLYRDILTKKLVSAAIAKAL